MVHRTKGRFLTTFIILIICASLLLSVMSLVLNQINVYAYDSDCRYISDMEYEPESKAGWVTNPDFPKGRILKDKTVNDTQITVKIEGAWYPFRKGMFTHATANIYYNVENCGYQYFTAYVGLDKTITKNSNGVKFFVYTADDDEKNWTLKTAAEPKVLGIGEEAEFLSVDISGAKYLWLHVDPNGVDRGDYAVWADAKLTNSSAGSENVQSLKDYDDKIKPLVAKNGFNSLENDPELELLVLQREFVRKVGQYALTRFTNEGADNEALLEWLMKDLDALREFIIGGSPVNGSYYNSLTVLSNLYRNYKTDLDNKTLLNNKWKPDRTYGDMYRTMMFAVALTHDGKVASWLQKDREENQSDPLRRYAIYKYLHNTGRFIATSNFETQSLFESLTVEEMRWIMYDIIDDESIIWLNDYVQTRINAAPGSVGSLHTPHPYMAYTTPNYNNPVFYAEENREYFNELFAVDDRENPGNKIGMWDTSYTIPGGVDHETYTLQITRGTESDKLQKVWMNFRNKFGTGAVCGGISKSGTNIRGARGIPATVIGQPGHAAMLCYAKNDEGKGFWGIDNDVSGWTLSTKGERHLLGWGNETWQRTHATVVYFCLAQDALNDYDNYVKAEEYVMLARVYEDDTAMREQIFKKALNVQSINIDAWYGLIKTYEAQKVRQDKYINIAKYIADTMVGYPLPMHDLFKVIEPLLRDTEYIYQLALIKNKALKASSVLPNAATDKTLLPYVARGEALFLLGEADSSIAKFSFDGENAGAIVWAERFDNSGIRWKYSLDNKKTWKEVAFTADEPHIHKLTAAELANVTEENDIYISIVGVPEAEENYYRIDISSKPTIPDKIFSNDNENKVLGLDERFEWRYAGDNTWISYSEQSQPDCTGNKTVEVRIKATGDKPPSDSKTFKFTADNFTQNRKYVSISRLTIEDFSSQSKDPKRPNYATNVIDGNIDTYWHTDYSENILTSGNDPYLVIKLDSPIYFSGLDLIQRQYNPNINIFAKNIRVSVSVNGQDWQQVALLENLEAAEDLRTVALDKSVYAQYVRIDMDTHDIFAAVSMVNIYEDATKTSGNKDNTAVKIVVPIVVCIVVIVAVVIIVKFKKKKNPTNTKGAKNKKAKGKSTKIDIKAKQKDKENIGKTEDNTLFTNKINEESTKNTKKSNENSAESTKKVTKESTASTKKVSDKVTTSTKKVNENSAESTKKATKESVTSAKKVSDKVTTSTKKANENSAESAKKATKESATSAKTLNGKGTTSAKKANENSVESAKKATKESTTSAKKVSDKVTTSTKKVNENSAESAKKATKESTTSAKTLNGKGTTSAKKANENSTVSTKKATKESATSAKTLNGKGTTSAKKVNEKSTTSTKKANEKDKKSLNKTGKSK